MYYRPYRQYSSSRNYLIPFLIIICVGVIIVLLFNLWKALFASYSAGDAYMHIVQGNVQVRTWGTEEFFDLNSDALIMKGDEIRTSSDAKIIIEFFDGTIMRLAGNTDVIINEIDNKEDESEMDLLLVAGKLWFNKLYKDTENTDIAVTTDNIVVKSAQGNIFEVENEFDEVVRVFYGDKEAELVVDVMTEDDSKVVETENIGVGQEMIFTDKVLRTYWQYQSPSILTALSDDFKKTDWYLWNDQEDKSPTAFSKAAILGKEELIEVEPEILEPQPAPEEKSSEEEATETESKSEEKADEGAPPSPVPEEPVVTGPLTTPTITSVAGGIQTNENGFYVVTSNLATLTGAVSGAEKVVVNNYTLQKFKPGDASWTYYANADYGLMQEGENIYEVYAVAPEGTRSSSLFVKVLYNPPKPEIVEAKPASEKAEEVEEESSPSEGDTEKVNSNEGDGTD